jgi:hypothetical protein
VSAMDLGTGTYMPTPQSQEGDEFEVCGTLSMSNLTTLRGQALPSAHTVQLHLDPPPLHLELPVTSICLQIPGARAMLHLKQCPRFSAIGKPMSTSEYNTAVEKASTLTRSTSFMTADICPSELESIPDEAATPRSMPVVLEPEVDTISLKASSVVPTTMKQIFPCRLQCILSHQPWFHPAHPYRHHFHPFPCLH